MLGRLPSRHNVCQKLERILPLVKKNIPELSGMSLSSMVVATSFASSKFLAPTFHASGCPFYSKQLPLTDLLGKTAPQAKVCVACLNKTIHFLASEAFCDDMESRCLTENFETEQVPQQLLSKLANDYESFSSFINELLFFATNQASPGRTWVVFDGEKISVMNLPSNTVPLVYGLWPLALINMSERFLCSEILSLGAQMAPSAHGVSQSVQRPFWSRASRNPFAPSSASGDYYTLPFPPATTENSDERLGKIRIGVSKRAVDCMRWSFVNNQLIEATNYFSSPGRRAAHSDFRAKQKQKASLQALRNYKECADAIQDFPDTIDSTPPVPTSVVERRDNKHDSDGYIGRSDPNSCDTEASADSPVVSASEGRPDEAKESPIRNEIKGKVSSQKQVSSFTRKDVDADTAAADDLHDTKVIQHADGSWEYQYQNGDRAFVYSDGTEVFKTENVTTTVRTDGSTLFEYANGSSILNRPDGTRVTTYSDGTSREEAMCPEA